MKRFFLSSPSRWLALVRILMLVCIIFSIVFMIISLPAFYQGMRSLEPGSVTGAAFAGWTPQAIQDVLAQSGFKLELVGEVMFSANLICLLCFWVVGILLFWNKSDTWVGLLAAFILFMTGPGFSGMLLTKSHASSWIISLYSFLAVLVWPTFFVFLYLFPNGKFVPKFTRYLAILPYLLFLSGSTIFKDSPVESIGAGVLLVYAVGGLLSQVYQYFRVSTPEERQQTKWVVFALGIFLGSFLTYLIPTLFRSLAVGTLGRFWFEILVNGILGVLITALIPLSIGASILRYRLWDIDVIIRKTLVYTILTVALALVFFGGVALLQQVFGALTGTENSPIAIVVSTLVIAALVSPLRKRLQDFIDRRFYRKKYNAEKTLARFAAIARDETEIERLSAELLAVVQETMQPVSASIWLKPARGKRLAFAPRQQDSGDIVTDWVK